MLISQFTELTWENILETTKKEESQGPLRHKWVKATFCTGCALNVSHGENRNLNIGTFLLSIGTVQKENSGFLQPPSLHNPLTHRLSSIAPRQSFEKREHAVFSPFTVGYFDSSWVSIKATEKGGQRFVCTDLYLFLIIVTVVI